MFRKTFVRLAMLVLFCFIIASWQNSFGQFTPFRPGHGALLPTPEQHAKFHKKHFRILRVHLNHLGLSRLNMERGRKHLSLIDQSNAVPLGNDIESVNDAASATPQPSGNASLMAGGLSFSSMGGTALPSEVDNSQEPWFPPIGDQGQQGSCVAWATTYYQLTYMNAMSKNLTVSNGDTTKIFSPKWTYNFVNGGSDNGSYDADAFTVLERNGAATLSQFPYDGNYLAWDLNTSDWQGALSVRVNLVQYLTSASSNASDVSAWITQIKQLLNNGYVLTFDTSDPQQGYGWQYTNITQDTNNPSNVGQTIAYMALGTYDHAMTIVGYDDTIQWTYNGVTGTGAFKIANQWGNSNYYGMNAGFFWLSYDALYSTSQITGGPASTSRLPAIEYNEVRELTVKPNYTPKMVAEFTVNQLKRNQLMMFLGTSATTSSTPSTTWYPGALYPSDLYIGGAGPYAFDGSTTAINGTFVIDFTDILPTIVTAQKYYLSLYSGASSTIVSSYKLIDLTTNTTNSDAALPLTVTNAYAYPAITYTFLNNHTPPVASATAIPSSGTAPLTVNFDGSSSTDSDGTISSYIWNFEDGSTGSGMTTSHVFTTAGTYNVVLTVTDGQGTTGSYTIPVIVSPVANPPVPSATATPVSGTAPLTVNFDGSASMDSDSTIISYEWNFGDGSALGSGVTVFHTYQSAGSYTAVLTVTDGLGKTASYAIPTSIKVTPALVPPVASATATPGSGISPLSVNFNGSASSDSDSTIASYSWNFGDGSTAGSGITVFHVYQSAGSYTAALTVTDNLGMSASYTIPTAIKVTAPVPPVASATATPTSGLSPLTVSFDGSASSDADSTIVSYSWNFGDGSTGTGVTTGHAYTTAGSYTAVLTITDMLSQSASYSIPTSIKVTAPVPPVASATATPTSGLTPLTVNFNGSASSDSDSTIASYSWNFGDGSASGSGVTANHIYTTAGSYTAVLTVKDNLGLSASYNIPTSIKVTAPVPPVASATATPTSGLSPLTVSFDGSASSDADSTIASYSWNFGDGSTAGSGVTVNHIYTTAGSYTAVLTVKDNLGLSASYNIPTTIKVTAPVPPVASATATPTSGLSPLTVSFDGSASSDADSTIASYSWNFGDGSTAGSGVTVNHIYTTAGSYTAVLTVKDNLGFSASYSIPTVIKVTAPALPVASATATPTSGLSPLTVSFDGSASSDSDSTIASYSWNFGDGSATGSGMTTSHIYTTAGSYTAVLAVKDNLGLSASYNIPTTIKVTAPVPPVASATATPTSGLTPLTVSFDGSASTDADSTIASYSWNFGDGSGLGSGVTANHVYTTAGNFTAVLTVKDNLGLSASFSIPTTIKVTAPALPVASATATPTSGLSPLTVSFDGSASTDADSTIASYSWNFGDGSVAGSGVTANHVYTTAGNFTAVLTVKDNLGLSASFSIPTTIKVTAPALPVASATATPTSGLSPLTVGFDGSASSDADSTIASYSWNFGDGSTAGSGVTVNHIYTTAGSYTAVLTVKDNLGFSTSYSIPTVIKITAPVPPVASATATPTSGLTPLTVSFDGSASSDADSTIASYSWNFGDGSATGSGMTTSHIYTSAGSYTAVLTVKDNLGFSASFSIPTSIKVTAPVPPVASATATPTSGLSPLTVGFDGSASSDVDSTISSYSWNFGDGSTAGSGVTTSHIYTTAGSYTAVLTVKDNLGFSASYSIPTTIKVTAPALPVASATAMPTSGLTPLTVSFDGSASSDSDSTIASYSWNFGDGSTAGSGVTTSHIYTTAGSYTAVLTVKDNLGFSASYSIPTVIKITAPVPPVASATATPTSGLTPLTVSFDGSASTDSDSTIASYSWNFGDGSALGSGVTANHIYTSAGSYTAVLTVKDNLGFSASFSIPTSIKVTAPVPPVASATATPTSGLSPLTVNFDGSASSDADSTISSYSWNFGDGSALGSGVTANHIYTTAGSYTAVLTVKDNLGFSASYSIPTVIKITAPVPPVASATATPTSGLSPLTVSFDGSASSDADSTIASYSWNFGDGSALGSGVTANHIYTSAGSYTTVLTVKDNLGFSASYSIPTTIKVTAPVPPVASATATPTSGLSPLTVSFDGSASSDADSTIASYSWNFGDGSIAGSGVTVNHIYTTAGSYTAVLTVKDNLGFSASYSIPTTIKVTAPVPPVASATATPTSGLSPLTVSFDGSASSDADSTIASYSWNFGDGSTAGSGVTVNHIYTTAGSYTAVLTVKDNLGFSASYSIPTVIKVTAPALPVASATATPTSGLSPLTVSFDGSASSDADSTIASYSWNFGDGSTGTGVSTSHIYTTAGTYAVVLTVIDTLGETASFAIPTSIKVTAVVPPVASATATPTSGLSPLTVNFNGSASSDTDSTITSYSWNFGDGSAAGSGMTTSHVYTTAGSYTAALKVTDKLGETVSYKIPTVIKVTSATIKAPSNLTGSVNNNLVTLNWRNNATNATGINVQEGILNAGVVTYTTVANVAANTTIAVVKVTMSQTYYFRVQAFNATTNTFSDYSNVITKSVRIPAASPVIGISPLTVNFNGSATSDPSSTVTYVWNFGDGSAAGSGVTPSHVYTKGGIFSVLLTATDNKGSKRTDKETIVVMSGSSSSNNLKK